MCDVAGWYGQDSMVLTRGLCTGIHVHMHIIASYCFSVYKNYAYQHKSNTKDYHS